MTASSPTNHSSSVAPPAPKLPLKVRFYRQCRIWHGYLSAFAFAALLFFAITGVALNHPDWFSGNATRSQPVELTLTSSQLEDVRSSQSPAQTLIKIVAARATVYGEYKDGELAMEQVFARLRGARGATDIRADLKTGSVIVTVERATTIALLNALHRGEEAGSAWRMFIDVVAGVLIVLSFVGYAIFFSMIARAKTAFVITGLGLIGTVTLVLAFVP